MKRISKLLFILNICFIFASCSILSPRHNFNIKAIDESVVSDCAEYCKTNPDYACSVGDQEKEIFHCLCGEHVKY